MPVPGENLENKIDNPQEQMKANEDKAVDLVEKGNPDKIKDVVDNDPSLQAAEKEIKSDYPDVEKQIESGNVIDTEEMKTLSDYIQNTPNDEKLNETIKNHANDIINSITILLNDNKITRDDVWNIEIVFKQVTSLVVIKSTEKKEILNSIQNTKINFVKEDMKTAEFTTNVMSTYINKKYKNEVADIAFITYLKDNFVIDEKNEQEIKKYFNDWLDFEWDKKFSQPNFNKTVNKDYSFMKIDDIKIQWLEELEIKYKTWAINKDVKASIESEVQKFGFDDETKKIIISWIQEDYEWQVQKTKYEDINKMYQRMRREQSYDIKNNAMTDVYEIVAEHNRAWVLDQFKNLTNTEEFKNTFNADLAQKTENKEDIRFKSIEKAQAHMESMLKETDNKDVTNLALALTYSGQNPKILNDLWKKIQELPEEKSVRFDYSNIDNKDPVPENKWLYSTSLKDLKDKEITQSLSEENKTAMLSYVTELSKNEKISDIKVQVPAWNMDIYNQIVDLIPWVDIVQIEWLSKVKIEAKESTIESAHLENFVLENLPYNAIWDSEIIEEFLIKTQNPEILAILSDPEYKITWWEIYGSASRQKTWYTTNNELNLQQYKNNKNITVENKIRDNLPDGKKSDPEVPTNPQIDEWRNGDGVTNNPTLAYDRATSLFDFFYKRWSVVENASIDLSYWVNGPSKKEILEQNPQITNEVTQKKELENLFKPYQYAVLDLYYEKPVVNPIEKDFDITEQELQTSFKIGIKPEKQNVASSGWGWGRPPIRWMKLTESKWYKPHIGPIPCPNRWKSGGRLGLMMI